MSSQEREQASLDAVEKAALDLFREGADEVTVRIGDVKISLKREVVKKWQLKSILERAMKVAQDIKKVAEFLRGDE